MKLPSFRRILREDMREAPTWVDKLIYPINLFFENVYDAFNKGITFEENISSQIKEMNFTTNALYDGTTAHFDSFSFLSTLKKRAKGLVLMQIIQDEAVYTPIQGGVYVDWMDINGTIRVSNITGLLASKSYFIRMMVI